MRNYDNKIITELKKVCTAEELVLVLIGDADWPTKRKVASAAQVLLDEYNEEGLTGGSKNINKLKDIFS